MYSNLSELSKLEMIRGLHQLRRSLLLSPRNKSKSKSSKGRKKSSKVPTFSDPEKQKLFDSLPDECKALFM